MKDHLDEFNKLILDLENVNINLEYEDKALFLLSSLPDSYEHFVDTLLYGRQILTLKDVRSALESKDLKKRTEGRDQGLGEGLVAKSKSKKKIKNKKNNNQRTKLTRKRKKENAISVMRKGNILKISLRRKSLKRLKKSQLGRLPLHQKMKEIRKV